MEDDVNLILFIVIITCTQKGFENSHFVHYIIFHKNLECYNLGGVILICFEANDVPRNVQQYKTWITKWLPGGGPVYTSGYTTICWAIWKCRNRACFDR